MTTIVLTAEDGTELAHVVFVGTADDYEFELDELFDHLDDDRGLPLRRSDAEVRQSRSRR